MGLPAVPVTLFKEYTRQVQSLLRGEDVLFRDGVRERWIRLMHTDHENFINIKDPIPFYLAANGPKALEAVGELADGWVTVGAAARHLDDDYAAILQAAKRAGRSTAKPYTVALTSGCVLREGESLMSDRVIAQVGPNTVPRFHAMWEANYGPGADLGIRHNPALATQYNYTALAAEYHTYIQEYSKTHGTPFDRLYLDVHRGHKVFLKPGEQRFVTQEVLAHTLTGRGPEIIERLEAMAAMGVDHVAIPVTGATGARDLIEDFGREVIAKRT